MVVARYYNYNRSELFTTCRHRRSKLLENIWNFFHLSSKTKFNCPENNFSNPCRWWLWSVCMVIWNKFVRLNISDLWKIVYSIILYKQSLEETKNLFQITFCLANMFLCIEKMTWSRSLLLGTVVVHRKQWCPKWIFTRLPWTMFSEENFI